MNAPTADPLSESAITEFLGDQSVGTLALAAEDNSYAVPVAYTFAPDTKDFYFRLGYGPGSQKRQYIETTEQARFVVAAETDAGWKSVVAAGDIEHRNTTENVDTLICRSEYPADPTNEFVSERDCSCHTESALGASTGFYR